MPDDTAMVPELEVDKPTYQRSYVPRNKCGGTSVLLVRYDGYKIDTSTEIYTHGRVPLISVHRREGMKVQITMNSTSDAPKNANK
jgi:hypothetical protein